MIPRKGPRAAYAGANGRAVASAPYSVGLILSMIFSISIFMGPAG